MDGSIFLWKEWGQTKGDGVAFQREELHASAPFSDTNELQ